MHDLLTRLNETLDWYLWLVFRVVQSYCPVNVVAICIKCLNNNSTILTRNDKLTTILGCLQHKLRYRGCLHQQAYFNFFDLQLKLVTGMGLYKYVTKLNANDASKKWFCIFIPKHEKWLCSRKKFNVSSVSRCPYEFLFLILFCEFHVLCDISG